MGLSAAAVAAGAPAPALARGRRGRVEEPQPCWRSASPFCRQVVGGGGGRMPGIARTAAATRAAPALHPERRRSALATSAQVKLREGRLGRQRRLARSRSRRGGRPCPVRDERMGLGEQVELESLLDLLLLEMLRLAHGEDNDSASASRRRERGESSKKIRTRISAQAQCPPGREIAPARLRRRSPDGARGPEVQHSRSGCAKTKGSARTFFCKLAAIQNVSPASSGVRSKGNEHDGL